MLPLTLGLVLILPATVACRTGDSGARSATANQDTEEAALRAADLGWSEAASRKDLDAIVSFMADDGETLPPNEPAARGRDAVRAGWEALINLPNVELRWQPARVEVAESGEMGFTSGTYTLSFTGPDGRPVRDRGKYLEVWKKVDGRWKCLLDAYSSDIPLPTSH
jgi:ketosteroid isomerase-like protein